ncbi:hypothetical protein [Microbulbifer rhizosphaerae]|uniref:Uncharacterized protein n=1 Tax=Microbulbifer rhizosphaerae TaxID=1562603 RepID=A0A7W4ZAE0_9GAMM|nr:hypothetical protein [Microbulbifer rhizosphaerae]MBB3062773.1 hypothetical protein [Microbulbifer rhizosphaerae]
MTHNVVLTNSADVESEWCGTDIWGCHAGITLVNKTGNRLSLGDNGFTNKSAGWCENPPSSLDSGDRYYFKATLYPPGFWGIKGYFTYQMNDASNTKYNFHWHQPTIGGWGYTEKFEGAASGSYRSHVNWDPEHNITHFNLYVTITLERA